MVFQLFQLNSERGSFPAFPARVDILYKHNEILEYAWSAIADQVVGCRKGGSTGFHAEKEKLNP